MTDDAFYIERFLDGEEKAFEAIVRKYQNRVLNIVFSLIGKDRESEDISQEAFLKVYRSLKGFR
ncbi:MAG: sigma factor, partial [Candidatus Omnitrophica bacterium]|nr:sigma factor [Candidatus Omnitrophota bacterium]